jgi:hypothetical protein
MAYTCDLMPAEGFGIAMGSGASVWS